jgi:hypothetical protein
VREAARVVWLSRSAEKASQHVRMLVECVMCGPVDPLGEAVPVDVRPVDASERRMRVVFDGQLDELREVVVVSIATSRRAVSIPADTPAPVRYRPSSTQRSGTYVAPSRPRKRWYAQCVVARRPCSRPAPARRREPVHTDVTMSAIRSA